MTYRPDRVIETDTLFTLDECPRCGRLILAGRVDGVNARLDSRTVPPEHAEVLHSYGVPVLVADKALSGLRVHSWSPATSDLTKPGRVLLCPHTCRAPRLKGK